MDDGRRVPDLILEQYALGELPERERLGLEAALEADPSLGERLEELRRSDEELLRDYPPARAAAEIRRRSLALLPGGGARGRAGARGARVVGASAAAALLVLVGALASRPLLARRGDDIARAKGGPAPAISLYREIPGGAQELRGGAVARAGDVVQMRYSARGAAYGAVFSVDGRGVLTFHLPAGYRGGPAAAGALEPQGAALDAAYELDDAPGFERFYFVWSASTFDLGALWVEASELAGRRLPDGAPRLAAGQSWSAITLLKEGGAR